MSMRSINEIIIHCSASPAGRADTVDDIRTWHVKKGWKDIGYHYVIHIDGSVHKGRDEKTIGAHCKGHNAHSIGICYVGGLTEDGKKHEDTRTSEQCASLSSMVKKLLKKYPKSQVFGHNELEAKDCPCFDVQKWLKEEGIK